jgi:hypothetical protein
MVCSCGVMPLSRPSSPGRVRSSDKGQIALTCCTSPQSRTTAGEGDGERGAQEGCAHVQVAVAFAGPVRENGYVLRMDVSLGPGRTANAA